MERRQHVYADMAVASWIRVRSAHIQSEAPVFILDNPQRRMGHHTRRLPASGERWVPCAALVGPGDAQGGAHCGGDESDDWKVRQHKGEEHVVCALDYMRARGLTCIAPFPCRPPLQQSDSPE